MLIPYSWLKNYFDKDIPVPYEVARLFTMHALEMETLEKKGNDTVIDFKITPNRAHDCLSIDGIARELSVLSGIPLKKATTYDLQPTTTEHELRITVEDSKLCPRYSGRIIENILMTESPVWLRERLEAIGQRSINNVVDITNYVMFATGQPLHAFDLDKLAKYGNRVDIIVRTAKMGEKLVTLDAKDIALDETMLVIADREKPVALAGIKGGKWAEVDNSTKHIILESANFEPTSTRKTSQKVGLRTDSEKRFENEITPELAGKAMEMATVLFSELASTSDTKIGKVIDVYPKLPWLYRVGVSTDETNKLLGTALNDSEITKILESLGFEYEYEIIDKAIREHIPECLNKPYKSPSSMREDAPKEFSCSSLVSYLYTMAGVWMPSLSVDKYVFGIPVNKDELGFGDLVFANTDDGKIYYETVGYLPGTKVQEGVDHVGMYMGDGNILHSSRSNGKVVIEPLESSKQFKNIVGYRRISEDLGEKRFIVSVPTERLDIRIKEDLMEEIGRLYGYENLKGVVPKNELKPEINKKLYYANAVRNTLIQKGFSEVYTYSLVSKGYIELENPMADDKKFLRENLADNLNKSLEQNWRNAPLLGLEEVKIFEIGNVFCQKDGEYTSCAIGVKTGKKGNASAETMEDAKKVLEKTLGTEIFGGISGDVFEFNFNSLAESLPEPKEYVFPDTHEKGIMFRPISQYPFALRDIAVFVPSGTKESEVRDIIEKEARDLLVRNDLFDKFEKDLPAPRPDTYFVYAVLCDDDSIYIGQTENLVKRWEEHIKGIGADHTKKHKPQEIIHYEEYKSREEAVKRESDLKTGFGREWIKREWEAGRTRQAGGKISYAFHLVFQSYEKTLSDDELNEVMNKITDTLNNQNSWQVR